MSDVTHQFGLFSFNEMKPKKKVPISAARIREVQALLKQGNGDEAAKKLRELREGLENYERRL